MTSNPHQHQDSHTFQRLQHASPQHLHLTTRRCFIGPIPHGWLDSHRREWYKHHLGIYYSSRAADFTASADVGRHRRVTGLEGPSVSASYRHSFPQPQHASDDEDDEQDQDNAEQDFAQPTPDSIPDAPPGAEATVFDPPAIRIPRASYDSDDAALDTKDLAHAEPISTHGDVTPMPSQSPRDQSPTRPLDPSTSSVKSDDTLKPTARAQRSDDQQTTAETSTGASSSTPVWHSARSSRVQTDSADASGSGTYLSAPSRRMQSDSSSSSRPKMSRSGSGSSFVTANEDVAETPRRLSVVDESAPVTPVSQQHLSAPESDGGGTTIGAASSRQGSMRSLLPKSRAEDSEAAKQPASGQETESQKPLEQTSTKKTVQIPGLQTEQSNKSPEQQVLEGQPGLVRFDLPEDDQSNKQQMNVRLAQMRKRETFKHLRRGKVHDGQIVKMERMLIRVDFTTHELPSDFNETLREKIETVTYDKWKEFMLVCRENDDDDVPFVLQLYRSRVIPATEKTRVKKRWTYEIQLRRSNTKINLFSSLDKTMVLWHPSRKGTKMYSLQSRSSAQSMEWYTFLRNALGASRTRLLTIGVPDLGVNLQVDKPFESLESNNETLQKAADGDEQAINQTIKAEQAVVVTLISRCMQMLVKSPEWASILASWDGAQQMGLAWKRYDRLEWIHGANEKKMYGTIGMEASHELELRPKQHYPTCVLDPASSTKEPLTEPPPVEGFLIRLTSQRGVDQRLGKLFFKRLYFSTHSQFLVFNRPAKTDPPPPPRMPMTANSEIPSSEQIADKTPLIYSINPYSLNSAGQIEWYHSANTPPETFAEHDRDAFDEDHRRTRNLLNCDGLIDLTSVLEVRDLERGATPADARVDEGEQVDFDAHVRDSTRDDGVTRDMDSARTFELVLRNGLVVRLQAFDRATCREWKARLTALIGYWTLRTQADLRTAKAIRAANCAKLKLDEAAESAIGAAAAKWEVAGSFASPELYHMCGLSACRAVHLAGPLFRKARQHGAFTRHLALLAHGRLLLFEETLRSARGGVLAAAHMARHATLDLRDCYVYSGASAAPHLLHRSTAPSGLLAPGVVPRMYPVPLATATDKAAEEGRGEGDMTGYTTYDSAAATTFVIWHGKRTSWFKSAGDSNSSSSGASGKGRARLKKVRALGAEGTAVVFRTRSRAERDRWVQSIALEMERVGELAPGVDVRVE